MVKIIEKDFVPLLIYNNKKEDDKLRKHYHEPSWNFPVVRFLNGEGKDLIPRKDQVFTRKAIANRMRATLKTARRPIPKGL